MAAFQILPQLEQKVVLIVIRGIGFRARRTVGIHTAVGFTLLALLVAALEHDRGILDFLCYCDGWLIAGVGAVECEFGYAAPIAAFLNKVFRLQCLQPENAAESAGTGAA